MSKQKIVVEEVERLNSLLSRHGLLPEIQSGILQVFINGRNLSTTELGNKVVGSEDTVLVLPVLQGG
ncbi:MoaD/ThiS family protein [Candidatus Bathyarchaeota archaeon]|nr:MoaD/ThiS family protein [Candidatus Bathyarchaeota archaeon]